MSVFMVKDIPSPSSVILIPVDDNKILHSCVASSINCIPVGSFNIVSDGITVCNGHCIRLSGHHVG